MHTEDGAFCLANNNNHYSWFTAGSAINDGIWHHRVITYDGTD